MKRIVVLFILLVGYFNSIAQELEKDFCNYWFASVAIYDNDQASCDNTFNLFLENSDSNLSDSLKVFFFFNASIRLTQTDLKEEDSVNGVYNFYSTIEYVCGNTYESCNIINPHIIFSDTLIDTVINFIDNYNALFDDKSWVRFNSMAIPFEVILLKNNICLKKHCAGYYLNQIIIRCYYEDSLGNTICKSENIYPINTLYENK